MGLVIESDGPPVSVGELCTITNAGGGPPVLAEVVGFRQSRVLLMPLGPMEGIAPGSKVTASDKAFTVAVGDNLLGRVLN